MKPFTNIFTRNILCWSRIRRDPIKGSISEGTVASARSLIYRPRQYWPSPTTRWETGSHRALGVGYYGITAKHSGPSDVSWEKEPCHGHWKAATENGQTTTDSIVKWLIPPPQHCRRTVAYDNGSENTEHEQTNKPLGTTSCFCNPYHSWEKGSVYNTLGLIRCLFPRKTDFAQVSRAELATIEFLLNTRPRKCSNYFPPLEVLTRESVALNGWIYEIKYYEYRALFQLVR